MMTNQQIIAVVQAAERGEEIEEQGIGWMCWQSWSKEDGFDFTRNNYRVKPKPRECWVNVYDGPARLGPPHLSRNEADRAASVERIECVHYVEADSDTSPAKQESSK